MVLTASFTEITAIYNVYQILITFVWGLIATLVCSALDTFPDWMWFDMNLFAKLKSFRRFENQQKRYKPCIFRIFFLMAIISANFTATILSRRSDYQNFHSWGLPYSRCDNDTAVGQPIINGQFTIHTNDQVKYRVRDGICTHAKECDKSTVQPKNEVIVRSANVSDNHFTFNNNCTYIQGSNDISAQLIHHQSPIGKLLGRNIATMNTSGVQDNFAVTFTSGNTTVLNYIFGGIMTSFGVNVNWRGKSLSMRSLQIADNIYAQLGGEGESLVFSNSNIDLWRISETIALLTLFDTQTSMWTFISANYTLGEDAAINYENDLVYRGILTLALRQHQKNR